MKNELIDETHLRTLGVAVQSAWMIIKILMKEIKDSQNFAKASIDNKVILIVDGYESYKGIETLKYENENGINVICLPPQCNHCMQPLDVSFFLGL